MPAKIVAIPVPTISPGGVQATLLALKTAIEMLAKDAVTTEDLVRLGLVTPQALASATGKSAAVRSTGNAI